MAKVWIVTGENCFSENGEVFWIEGVYSSEKKAQVAAQFAVENYREEFPHKTVLAPGESDVDWDVCFEVDQREVE
jgi:hypothetical protein